MTASTSSVIPSGTIVVGIDGSAGADHALDRAVEQAALERRPLTVAFSGHLSMGGDSLWLGQPGIDVTGLVEQVRLAGHGLLDNARRRAQRHAPDLVVHQVLGTTDPRRFLLELAENAAMLVVGSRGRGGLASALLGSVSVGVAKRAACPVVVVRHTAGDLVGRGVVVDVDGTPEGRAAVEFAYRTASLRSQPLTALRIIWDPEHRGDDEHVVADSEPGHDRSRLLLAEATAGMREKFPDVEEHRVLVRGLREHQLVRASLGADLLVLASRHQGTVDDVLLGSVAPLVEHARCDVAVVHGRDLPVA